MLDLDAITAAMADFPAGASAGFGVDVTAHKLKGGEIRVSAPSGRHVFTPGSGWVKE